MMGAQGMSDDTERRERCISFADFAETRERTVRAVAIIGGMKLGHEFARNQIIDMETAARRCQRFPSTHARIQSALTRVKEMQNALALRIFQQA